MLKKLLKGIVWLVVLLAAAGFLFVWQGLGVNPFEGDADRLWDLTSNQVDFFARFPGTDLLSEPVVEGLGEEEGLDFIARAKDLLADAAGDVAREANPQIPLGLFQIDLENDMKGKEVAVAGLIRGDFTAPRLDNFIVLVRVPGYAKFVSALQRDFVRSRIPNSDRISVVKGKYFKVEDPEIAKALAPLRSGRGREEPDALWFARIRDVLLLTDEPTWIEDALRGGADTLPADVDFKTEFIPVSTRRSDVELLLRPGLAQSFMHHLGRLDRNEALYYVSRLVPVQVVGNVVAQASPGEDGVALRVTNHPLPDGYAKMAKQHLVKLYEREKADLRFDFTENGIGRLLPRKGVAGALVFHADADTVASLFADALPDAVRSNLDSVASQGGAGGRAYGTYEALLAEIGKDLGDTHMVVVHRPAAFERADYSGADIPETDPSPQPSLSIVCAVKDSSTPEKVVEKISQNLKYLGLEKPRDAKQLLHPSGKYYVADPQVSTGDMTLVHPAYAALTEGGRYFVFTSSVENMEAILAAARDPGARLLAEPGIAECAAKLPASGTLSILARGEGIRDLLADRVRTAFMNENYLPELEVEWRARKKEEGIKDENELDRLVGEESERFKASEYPAFRDRYRRRVAPLALLDTAILGFSLGVGPSKVVAGEGYLLVRSREGATE
jgi:hypothetical protein